MKLEDKKNDGKVNEQKNKSKRIEKDYIKLIITERANLKQLSKRKFISFLR